MLTVFGHTDGLSGTSRHALSFSHAFSRHQDLAWVPLDQPPPSPQGDLSNNIGLGIGAPDVMPRVRGRRRIAWAVWETTRIPESRLRFLRDMDEVWTPTDWNRQVLIHSGLDQVQVRVVPEGVDPEVFRPIPRPPKRPDAAPSPFRFLSIGKWEPRKGHDLLLRAWSKAFAPNAPVELVLHTYHPQDPHWTLNDALRQLDLGPHARVVWSRPTTPIRLVLLYNSCDGFVLATRGEGWGLPIFEALACAKPVIVPCFGALEELLDKSLAYLVRVDRLVPADALNNDCSEDCGLWAEPDLEHLVELLRLARADPEAGQARGEAGRAAVIDRWSWDQSARIARSVLQT